MTHEIAVNSSQLLLDRGAAVVSSNGKPHPEKELIASVASPDATPEFASNFSRKWELTHKGMQDDALWRVRFGLGNGIRTKKPSVDGSEPVNYVRGLFEHKPQRFETREDTTPAGLNIPNPDFFEITSGEGTRIEPDTVVQSFNMRHAILTTSYDVRDDNGNLTSVERIQFASQTDPHMELIRYKITPHHNGKVTVVAAIDGKVNNGNVIGQDRQSTGKKINFFKEEKKKKYYQTKKFNMS